MCSQLRSVDPNLPLRCAAHVRSITYIDESVMVCKAAANYAVSGETGKMTCFVRTSSEPYKCEAGLCDIASVANAVRSVPREFITERGNNVTADCVNYIAPLIMGEAGCTYKNGLPDFITLK